MLPTRGRHETRRRAWMLLECGFNWCIWSLLVTLVLSQFLGIVWNTASSYQYVFYGLSPLNATVEALEGSNDEPYSDRNLVCIPRGRSIVPTQLTKVLEDARLSQVVDTTGVSVNGYRVSKRETTIELDGGTVAHYAHICELIDSLLETIQQSCDAMGYNVTRDVLRIVDGARSDTMFKIPRALPVLVMPFWDNAVHAHYAIPGQDGMACLFRLVELADNATSTTVVVRGASRTTREAKTAEWLGNANGVWRNGWYEDTAGQRWNSDMLSTKQENVYGIHTRHFDGHGGAEYNCESSKPPMACQEPAVAEKWGTQFSATDQIVWSNQASISNGTRFGLFMFEAWKKRTVTTTYSLEMLISNMSVSLLLVRWFVALALMLNSYRLGLAESPSTGIGGCISSSRTFNLLLVALLPRLKITLAAFWTVGCEFEGQQAALAEAWAAIYPGIAEFMLFYYSLLNFLAKATHRRMSDALFGPSLVFLCLLHRFRLALALTGWLGYDGRISTIMMSDEVNALTLVDFFTTDVALRINGNVRAIFYTKLAVVLANFLPLLLSQRTTYQRRHGDGVSCEVSKMERILAMRALDIGGIGLSSASRLGDKEDSESIIDGIKIGSHRVHVDPVFSYPRQRQSPDELMMKELLPSGSEKTAQASPSKAALSVEKLSSRVLSSYELNRLGYLVFGGRFLLSYDDWYVVASFVPLRWLEKLWNHRVVVFEVELQGGVYCACSSAQLLRLDDSRLLSIPFYSITIGPFR